MNMKSSITVTGMTIFLLTTGSTLAQTTSDSTQEMSSGGTQEVSVGGIQDVSQGGRPLLKKWWDLIREISSGG